MKAIIHIIALASYVSALHIADVGYATYAGRQSDIFPNSVAFLGVPYAEPPLAELRFRAPVTLNTTRISEVTMGQTIPVTDYPDFCIQGAISQTDRGGAGSEDCLKVNIYTPVNATNSSKLPVLVYIHGGGYVFGNPANWPFDHWIQQSPNIVVVSVYYRLAAFGFLSTSAFTSSPSLGDNNAGFQDQLMALQWVQKNIAAFGGDPQKVTINGQSAGGSSVELHLIATEGSLLFSGAIAQSVASGPIPTPEKQVPLFNAFATLAGCSNGSDMEKLVCLRNATVSALAMAQDSVSRNATLPYHSWRPVVDGTLISEHPTMAIVSGRSAAVPIMVGATSNETAGSGTDPRMTLKTSFPALSSTELDEFIAEYPLSEFSSNEERLRTISGEPNLRRSRSTFAGAYVKRRLDAFTYRYNQPNPTQQPGSTLVEHAAENWMMFLGTNTGSNGSTSFTTLSTAEQDFAAELIAYWVSFVRVNDPNKFKLERSPVWEAYSTENRNRIVLQEVGGQENKNGSGSYMEAEPQAETRRCAFIARQADTEA